MKQLGASAIPYDLTPVSKELRSVILKGKRRLLDFRGASRPVIRVFNTPPVINSKDENEEWKEPGVRARAR